tara:strand:- start:624 stop:899 length:276 start_codon:yes stop_codon:yes gene_type:complete
MTAQQQLQRAIQNDAGLAWGRIQNIGLDDYCAHIDDAGYGIIAGPVGNSDEASFQVIDSDGVPVSDSSTYYTAERAVAEAELCELGAGSHQ